MPKDPEFEYISRVNLAVIIESLLARITKDRPTEVLTHISAVAFSVKAESQAKQLKNEWPKFIAQDELLDSLEFDCFQWNGMCVHRSWAIFALSGL
ncbi:hypothetical protein DIPPA_25335 [Diplonema papillatum]|nr:hypothetical protein DIPPA_25335 [Diplonema papillatum]